MKLSGKSAKYGAEAIATFAMVFAGTGAIVSNQMFGGRLTHLGVSLTFGLIVMAMIYAVGHISGAHMNPAVSLAFASIGRLAWREVPMYVGAQVAGAIAASAAVRFVFGNAAALGATFPSGSAAQSFVLEFLMTALLLFVVVGVAHDERAEGLMAGVAIGATIALEALIGGPVSGASMNPARSLAPALVGGQWAHLWIYLLAPVLGALAGAFGYEGVRCAGKSDATGGACC